MLKIKKSIHGVKLIGKYSVYESKEGLLYIGGISTKKGKGNIYSINLDSLSIESITSFPTNIKNYKASVFFSYEKEDSLVIRTHYHKLIEFDKKT